MPELAGRVRERGLADPVRVPELAGRVRERGLADPVRVPERRFARAAFATA